MRASSLRGEEDLPKQSVVVLFVMTVIGVLVNASHLVISVIAAILVSTHVQEIYVGTACMVAFIMTSSVLAFANILSRFVATMVFHASPEDDQRSESVSSRLSQWQRSVNVANFASFIWACIKYTDGTQLAKSPPGLSLAFNLLFFANIASAVYVGLWGLSVGGIAYCAIKSARAPSTSTAVSGAG